MLKDMNLINCEEKSILKHLQLSGIKITESALSFFHTKEKDNGNFDKLKLTIQNSRANSGVSYKTVNVPVDIRKQDLVEALSGSK